MAFLAISNSHGGSLFQIPVSIFVQTVLTRHLAIAQEAMIQDYEL
jgi:hypothetical protein